MAHQGFQGLAENAASLFYFGDSPGFQQKKIDRFLLSKDLNIGQLIAKGKAYHAGHLLHFQHRAIIELAKAFYEKNPMRK